MRDLEQATITKTPEVNLFDKAHAHLASARNVGRWGLAMSMSVAAIAAGSARAEGHGSPELPGVADACAVRVDKVVSFLSKGSKVEGSEVDWLPVQVGACADGPATTFFEASVTCPDGPGPSCTPEEVKGIGVFSLPNDGSEGEAQVDVTYTVEQYGNTFVGSSNGLASA